MSQANNDENAGFMRLGSDLNLDTTWPLQKENMVTNPIVLIPNFVGSTLNGVNFRRVSHVEGVKRPRLMISSASNSNMLINGDVNDNISVGPTTRACRV